MGTKQIPGQFDCYANALDDEPMFVLLARDELAPGAVRDWAERYKSTKELANAKHVEKNYKIETIGGRLTVDQYAKYCEALDCADAMTAWRGKYDNLGRINKQVASKLNFDGTKKA